MKSKTYTFIAVCFLFIPSISIADYKIVLTPKISLNGELTDNVNLSSENEEDDYITTFSPGLDFEVSKRNRGVIISYEPGYSRYDKNSTYNTWRHSVQLSGWTDISPRTNLTINNTFRKSEDPISEEDTTIRRDRIPYVTNTANFDLTHQIGMSDSISIGYIYSILDNEDPAIQDNTRHNPSISFSQMFNPYMGIEIGVAYTRGEYSGPSDDFDNWNGSLQLNRRFAEYFNGFLRYAHTYMNFEGESDDYQIYDPSVGISYIVDEGTSLSIGLGYFLQDRERSNDTSDLTIESDIVKIWTLRRGSVNLTGSSGYGESYFGAEILGFNIYYQGGGSVNYLLTRNLTCTVSGSYRFTDYKNLAADREDRTANASAGLTYDPPIRWLPISIGLNYSYRSNDSTQSENEYTDSRVLFDVSTSKMFSKPIRF